MARAYRRVRKTVGRIAKSGADKECLPTELERLIQLSHRSPASLSNWCAGRVEAAAKRGWSMLRDADELSKFYRSLRQISKATAKSFATSVSTLTFPWGNSMVEQPDERWKELCRQATVEQDPAKLRERIVEINNLLEAKKRV